MDLLGSGIDMKNWTTIDQQAESAGIAERKLRQCQTKHNHKAILHNTIARSGQIPVIIVKRRKTKIKRSIKPKRRITIFSLED